MKKKVLYSALLTLFSFVHEDACFDGWDRGNFYLDAVHGNDDWFGFSPDADLRRFGPFRTFETALYKIRRIRQSRKLRNVTLHVKSGTYLILNPIILDDRDSQLTIVKYSESHEKPRIIGGIVVNENKFFDWRNIQPNVLEYRTKIDTNCSNHVFVDKKRLIRSRKPNTKWTGNNFVGEGPYLTIKDLLHPTSDCNRKGSGGFKQSRCPSSNLLGFYYNNTEVNSESLNLAGEITVFHSWLAERAQIESVENSRILFKKPLRRPIGEYPIGSGWRYLIKNTYEELDSIGEFYCNDKSKYLSIVLPRGGLENKKVIIANNSNFFKIKGASKIRFEGLSFEFSGDQNFYGYNSKPALLQFLFCKNIKVYGCQFKRIGHNAISIDSSFNVEIKNNLFENIGYKGVVLEYNDKPFHKFATRNVAIKQNKFDMCGTINLLQPSCIHVRGVNNINVVSNRISRTTYAGIQVGWQKAFNKSFVENDYIFKIRRNHIFDYGKNILNDFGGIYVSTNQEDCGSTLDISMCHLHTLIEENVIHDGYGYHHGGKAIYTDTAASSITVRRNWLYGYSDAAVVFHCGLNNFAYFNVIVHSNKQRLFGMCNSIVGVNGTSPKQVFL